VEDRDVVAMSMPLSVSVRNYESGFSLLRADVQPTSGPKHWDCVTVQGANINVAKIAKLLQSPRRRNGSRVTVLYQEMTEEKQML